MSESELDRNIDRRTRIAILNAQLITAVRNQIIDEYASLGISHADLMQVVIASTQPVLYTAANFTAPEND